MFLTAVGDYCQLGKLVAEEQILHDGLVALREWIPHAGDHEMRIIPHPLGLVLAEALHQQIGRFSKEELAAMADDLARLQLVAIGEGRAYPLREREPNASTGAYPAASCCLAILCRLIGYCP